MEKTLAPEIDSKAWYLSNFDFFESKLNGNAKPVFHEKRRAAIAKFAELGFPNTHNEEWKYTNVAALAANKFKLAAEPVKIAARALDEFLFAGMAQNLLVFVNGRFAPELSRVISREKNLVIDNLPAALQNGTELGERHLAHYAQYEKEAFIALNTAFAHEGACILVPNNMAVAEPIHLLYVSDGEFAAHPRNLIVLGKNSQARVIESYHSLHANAYFNNIVSEIVLEENAKLEHVRIQNESRAAYHIAAREVKQSQHSVYTSISVDLGGALVRNNFNVRLTAENCEGNLFGFYMAGGAQLVDNHTLIDHLMPHCQSNEHYKGILADKAQGVFNGKVMVHQDAQKTNAYQSNQCLLLSDEANINSKPQLEIFADDVKCSHGATIGQLDEEQLFYLRARGIGLEEANAMLRYAFASEILQRIDMPEVAEKIEEMVHACFRQGAQA